MRLFGVPVTVTHGACGKISDECKKQIQQNHFNECNFFLMKNLVQFKMRVKQNKTHQCFDSKFNLCE